LQGEPHVGYINELHWNHYEGWPDGIDKYRIYRDSGTGFALLTEVTANTDYFSDNVSTYASQGGVFSYFIEALENGNGQATSKSNQLTLEMETKILAPMDDPKIAIAVVVENAGFGSTYAAPIATLMMKKYLQGDFEKPYYEEIILEANMIE
jgi:hypothetical protein